MAAESFQITRSIALWSLNVGKTHTGQIVCLQWHLQFLGTCQSICTQHNNCLHLVSRPPMLIINIDHANLRDRCCVRPNVWNYESIDKETDSEWHLHIFTAPDLHLVIVCSNVFKVFLRDREETSGKRGCSESFMDRYKSFRHLNDSGCSERNQHDPSYFTG